MSQPPATAIPAERLAVLLGGPLRDLLDRLRHCLRDPLYLTGGTVRDLLLERTPADLDLTVAHGGRRWAKMLAESTGGAFVPLGKEEDAARVVWGGRVIDFSSFRHGAVGIEEELRKRDFTVNALAVPLEPLFGSPEWEAGGELPVLDPTGGLDDLAGRWIRCASPRSFIDDPLRLLRVFRFAATLDFAVDEETLRRAAEGASRIQGVAAERISHELDLLMESGRAAINLRIMGDCGLLWEILPELQAGVGMEQPASHHLDVFDHCLAALAMMEVLQRDPGQRFPGADHLLTYLEEPGRRLCLCWAALLHDVGKPPSFGRSGDEQKRIIFHNHDLEGARLIAGIGARLRWSNFRMVTVGGLVRLHMRPFHLSNVRRSGKTLSLKAKIRLVRAAGEDLEGLFLLAMADSLAGRGESRPPEMEREIDLLYKDLVAVRRDNVEPVKQGRPLLTGHDLMEQLRLVPGPGFKKILAAIDQARMEMQITTREEALDLARRLASRENCRPAGSLSSGTTG